jgi:signal transduction histidine kinase
MEEIGQAQEKVWWMTLAAGLVLFAVLFLIVARAARVIRLQQRALVGSERLSTAGEMASAVAHGLRNPLASIRSSAELGLAARSAEQVRELLRSIVSDADRLESWIRQFLYFAQAGVKAGEPGEPEKAIAAALTQFEPLMARRRIALERALKGPLPRVRLNDVILGQILNSVIANALEAMGEGGRLRLAAWADRQRVTLEVGDTGPGMSPDQITAALSPFVTSKPTGLGLGLPLARDTLERQGGRLEIESRPGSGTTMRLRLPRSPTPGRQPS